MPHTVGHNPDTVFSGPKGTEQEYTATEYLGLAMRREAEGDIVGALQYFNKVQGLPRATSQQIETAQGYIQRLKASYPEILDTIASGPVQRAQALFDVGLRLKGQGNTAAANTNFESALEVITAALGTVGQDPAIKTQLEQIRQLTLTEKPDTRKTTAPTVEQELMDFPGMPTTPLAMGDGFTRTSYVSPLGEDAEPLRSRPEEYVEQISRLLGGVDPQGRPAFGTPAMRSIQRGLESGFADQHTRWLLESAAQPLGQVTQFEDWLGERGLQRPAGDKLPTYWQEAITQGSLFPTLSEQQSIEFISKARAIPLFGTPTSDGTGFTGALTQEQKWAARSAMGGATTGLFGRINNQRFNSLLAGWENLRRSDPEKYSSPTFLPWVARQLSSDAPGYFSGFSQGTVTTSTAAVPGTASTAATAVSNAGVTGYTEDQAKEAQDWGNAQADAEAERVKRLSRIEIGSVEYNKLTAFEQTLANQLQQASFAKYNKETDTFDSVPNTEALDEDDPFEIGEASMVENPFAVAKEGLLNLRTKKAAEDLAKAKIAGKKAITLKESSRTPFDPFLTSQDISELELIKLGEADELTPSEEQAHLNRLQSRRHSGTVQEVGEQAFVSRPLPEQYIPFTDPALPLGDTSYFDTPGPYSVPIGAWGHTGEFDISGPYGRSAGQQADIEARAARIIPGTEAYKEQEIYSKALADANEKHRIDQLLGRKPTYEQTIGAVDPWQSYDTNVPAIVPRLRTRTTGPFGAPSREAITDAFNWFMTKARGLPFS